MKETYITAGIFALLALLAASSWLGLGIAVIWLSVGAWMVARSRSRGLWADISFLATWPLYVILGR